MAKKKQIRNVLCFLVMIAILVSVLPIFVTQSSAVMPVDNYMGKVTGKNNDVLTVQIGYKSDYSDPPNWVYYSTSSQWTVSNSDVINEIGIGDYIEIAGYMGVGSDGDSVCIGKMKSRTEKVITDVYGDPDYLMPVHAFTKLTGNLNPPLLGDYIIEYENTPDCSKYQDIRTSGCNVYAKYSDVTIHKGNRQLNSQRLYPDQNYVYEDGKCNVDITFNSGEASAYPDCTDQPCFGPQSFSDFTIHVKKIGETKPTHPSPKIVEVKVPPACVKEDEYATVSVTVKNNGGTSSEGYISVSFPHDEYIPRSRVSGTGSEHNKLYQKGSEIWGTDGKIDFSEDPLVELQERNWDAEESHTLTMNVKPNSGSDEIVFYVRAALKNDVDESYERDPTYSGYTDQQGWYVKKYSVNICGKPDLIDLDIINRFDDKTPQYIHDVFTWVKCVVDKMLRDAFLSFVNAPKEPGVYIDNTINLKFENYKEIYKVSGIFGTDYFRWDKITFNNAGNGVYTRHIQVESPVKWRYDAVNTIFKSLSGTGKLPNVPEIGPDTLPEVRLHSVLVELNDGSTVTFEINECLKMFSKSNTFPTLVNRDQDYIVAACPIHLLVIDKQGRKVGIEKSSTTYLEFHEIPNAIYSRDTEPEYIILCDIPEYSVVIQAVEEGKFDFKIDRSTTKTTMTYLDVPVTETTIATVDVSKANPAYTMEIDNNGDGTTDYTKEPDSIETIEGVSETKTCKVQITTNPSLQDRPSIVHVNGNYYIAYQSHEKGYGIYIKQFDSNWKFKKKVEVASGSAYYDSPSLLFANNKLYVAYITNANGANANDYDVIVKEYNPSSLSCTKGAKFLTSLQSCQDLPAIYHKDGYFYMAYQSWEKGDGDIFIKKFDSNLNMLTKVQVTTKSSLQDRPSITYANGYFYVAYFSEETGYYDIFVKRLDSNLNLASWKEQITTKSSYQSYPFITFVNNQFVISYASTEFGTLGIYMKKYDSHWNFIEKTEVIDSSAYERRPSHIWDGSNFWVAYVYNQGDSQDWNIFAIRPDSECGSVHCRGLE